MVNTLQFNLSAPTPYVFMRRFLKAAQSDKKVWTYISIIIGNNHMCIYTFMLCNMILM